MELNKTELKDLDYLMKKIIDGEPFYALEISKARYLLTRIKNLEGLNWTSKGAGKIKMDKMVILLPLVLLIIGATFYGLFKGDKK